MAIVLGATPVCAQVRTGAAPVKAPTLAPSLTAPGAPSLTATLSAPTLALPAAPSLIPSALPAAAVPRATPRALAVPAAATEAPEAAKKTLAAGAQALERAPESSRGETLHAIFSGAKPAAANAAAVLGSEPQGRAPLRLLPAGTPGAVVRHPARPLDTDGSRMRAALRELQRRSAPEPLVLDFAPTPATLQEMAKLDREVFLYRERGTGVWRLAGGDRWGVSGNFGDYDLGLHNHPDMRLGVHSLTSPYPSPEDVLNAAGKDARVFVVSAQGVAEWSPTYPAAEEAKSWLAGLERSWLGRVVMRLTFPAGYPALARSQGIAMELRPWRKVTQDWLDSGRPPETAATLERRLAPALAEEAVLAARRLAGRDLSDEETADVVRRTRMVAVGWAKALFNEFGVMASYPDGVARPDLSIELTLRRRLPDAEAYYRALFAHEYTHRLQFEGDVTRGLGVEIPPVAAELLRGIELVGLDALKAGRIPFISPNVLDGFESGQLWADGTRSDPAVFYRKGALAGAAWALAARTGRPEDAWEFVRRVSSQRRPETATSVFSDILSRKFS